MKILITGANGFVGCRVARFLGMSHQVVALSSKELDITDIDSVFSVVMEHLPKAIIQQHCPTLPIVSSTLRTAKSSMLKAP